MVQTTAHRLQVGWDNWDTLNWLRWGCELLELIQLGVV